MASSTNDYLGNHYCTAYAIGPNTTSILTIMLLIISSIALIMLSLIAYHSCSKILKQERLHDAVKFMFMASVITSYFLFIIILTRCIICIGWNLYLPVMYLDSIFILVYCTLLQILLAMYFFRLYSAFNDSTFALTKLQMSILGSGYIIITILMILYIIDYMIVSIRYKGDWKRDNRYFLEGMLGIWGYMGPIALTLYIFVSIYALYLFINNLLKLVKMCSFDAELSPSQRFMINSAAKYASILSLAIITSIISVIGWNVATLLWDVTANWNQYNSFLQQIMLLTSTMDAIVNELCLYLQFSFTAKYYDKYCQRCMAKICYYNQILTNDAKKSIEIQPISLGDTSAED
eukprot:19534_1